MLTLHSTFLWHGLVCSVLGASLPAPRVRALDWPKIISQAASAIVVLVGGLVLGGWMFSIPGLKSIIPGREYIGPDAALCFILAGLSLWFLVTAEGEKGKHYISRACAFGAGLIGLLTLWESTFGWNLGIEDWLFQEPSGPAGSLQPGRMAAAMAFSFLLVGIALLCLSAHRFFRLAELTTLVVALIPLVNLTGYLYGARSLYDGGSFVQMTAPAAVTLLLLCAGLLVTRHDRGLMAIVTSGTAGGVVARRLFLAGIVLPLALGWLRSKGEQAGFFHSEAGLSLLVLSIVVFFGATIAWNATTLHRIDIERKRVEGALRHSEALFRAICEASPSGIFFFDTHGSVLYANPADLRMTGLTWRGRMGLYWLRAIHPDDRERVIADWQATVRGEGLLSGVGRYRHEDGTVVWWDVNTAPVRMKDKILGYVGLVQDITEQKRLEEQLRQAQRMEAIGLLAGGVAHDFNNLLTAILGYAGIAMNRLGQSDPLRAEIDQIDKAAGRAAALTNQLLAFSRRQVLQPRVLNLNEVVDDLERMLRRLIGEDIELSLDLDDELGPVMADPGQIEQIIMNLVVNARDAMPRGGRLTIGTRRVDLDETYCEQHIGVGPGSYITLRISDTGQGMDEETKSRIFEPFFTTKGEGRGTGLGLSVVYGIVKQSGGHIDVESEPGKGTTLKVYLPRIEKRLEIREERTALVDSSDGWETILIVEDEQIVRGLAVQILRMAGYTVLEAVSANDAVQLCERYDGPIHLLVSDVVMPQMSGRQLAERLAPVRPEMRVLYISGHADEAIVEHGVPSEGVPLLQKPFTAGDLKRMIRELLDAPPLGVTHEDKPVQNVGN